MSAKYTFLISMLLLASLNVSCGSGGSSGSPAPSPSTPVSPTPTPTPTPNPSAPVPNVNGNWTGTLESSSFPTKVISARFVQASPDCVDGSWNTNPPDVRWIGAISVFALPGILDGFMSFEFPGSGSKLCTGVGNLTGDATDDTATLTWTITSPTPDTCTTSTVPKVATVRLRRQ